MVEKNFELTTKLDEALEENYTLQEKIEDDFSLVNDEFGERNESLSKEFEGKIKVKEEEIHSRDKALEILRGKSRENQVELVMPKIGTQVKSKEVVKPPSGKTMHVSHEEPNIFASNLIRRIRRTRRKNNVQPSRTTSGGTFSTFILTCHYCHRIGHIRPHCENKRWQVRKSTTSLPKKRVKSI